VKLGVINESWLVRIRTVLCLLIIAAIGHSLANLTWFLATDLSGQSVASSAVAKPRAARRSSPTQQSSQLAAVMPSWDLFGKPEEKRSAEPEKPVLAQIEAPKTSLRLSLEGVFIGDTDEETGAIISEQRKPGEYFVIGDTLPGNATLAAVFTDRVLLKRGVNFETLSFDEEKDLSEQFVASTVPRTTIDEDDDDFIDEDEDELPQISNAQDFVEVAREKLEGDPDEALKSVGLAQNSDGEGYRVSGQSNPVLINLGLQEGDIILSVNGHILGDVDADRAILDQITTEGDAKVEIQRGSRRFTVYYPIK